MKKFFKSNRKGNVTMYIMFMIIAILIVLVAGVFVPMGILFNTQMYVAGQNMINRSNEVSAKIQDTAVRTKIQSITSGAIATTTDNIDIMSDIYKYSWIFVIGLTGIILFLYSRRIVEYGGGLI